MPLPGTLHTLRNGPWSMTVSPTLGAEVSSLTCNGTELLHRGNTFEAPTEPNSWYGHGQTLFPAVGRHKEGRWEYEGQVRPMPLHGLAMTTPFRVLESGADTLVTELALEDLDPAQRASYPFQFRLAVTHRVTAEGMSVTHKITNEGSAGAFPFAIGNHISFAFPLLPSSTTPPPPTWSRGALTTNCPMVEHKLAPGSLLSGEVVPRGEFTSSGGAPLDAPGVLDGVFGAAAGGEEEIPGGVLSMSLSSGGGGTGVTVYHRLSVGGTPTTRNLFFVLWGTPPANTQEAGQGFLCLEPWVGGPDALNTLQCPLLGPGESAEWVFGVALKTA